LLLRARLLDRPVAVTLPFFGTLVRLGLQLLIRPSFKNLVYYLLYKPRQSIIANKQMLQKVAVDGNLVVSYLFSLLVWLRLLRFLSTRGRGGPPASDTNFTPS
jgi:hypothetical protein